MTTIESILKHAEQIGKEPGKPQDQRTINLVKLGMRVAIAECQKWIPVEEELPEASKDKSKWWTSDIGEVFPYSEKCIVENEEGENFIEQYSVLEKCWAHWCGNVVKWRYLEIK